MDAVQTFVWSVNVPLIGVFVAVVWLLTLYRLSLVRKAFRSGLPSRWPTASGVFLVAGAGCYTATFACWVALDVLMRRIFAVDAKYAISPSPLQPLLTAVPPGFAPADMHTVTASINTCVPIMYAGRLAITVALWTTKLAFVGTLAASADCLGRALRWALYATVGVLAGSLVGGVLVMSWDIVYSPFPVYTAADFIDAQLYNGLLYDIYPPQLEFAATGLNIATDILICGVTCLILRTLSLHRRDLTLPLAILALTLATAVARLVVMAEFFRLSRVYERLGSNVSYERVRGLTPAVVVLSEFEVMVSALVSCLPSVRAWARERGWAAGRSARPSEAGASCEGTSVAGSTLAGAEKEVFAHSLRSVVSR